MVDFNKLREQRNKEAVAASTKPLPPSNLERFQHQINHHLGEMTEWESNFCYSNLHYLKNNPGAPISQKVAEHLKNIEDTYCGSMCHALNKAGISHD